MKHASKLKRDSFPVGYRNPVRITRSVWKAWCPKVRDEVVLKFPDRDKSPTVGAFRREFERMRFLYEYSGVVAKAKRRIKGTHTCYPPHNLLAEPLREGDFNGMPFFVMRAIGGQTLQEFLDGRKVALPTAPEIDHIMFGLSCSLELHAECDLAHRDIKPANVMLEWPNGETDPSALIARAIDAGSLIELTTHDAGVLRIRTWLRTAWRWMDENLFTQDAAQAEQPEDDARIPIGNPDDYLDPRLAGAGRYYADSESMVYSLGMILFRMSAGCNLRTIMKIHKMTTKSLKSADLMPYLSGIPDERDQRFYADAIRRCVGAVHKNMKTPGKLAALFADKIKRTGAKQQHPDASTRKSLTDISANVLEADIETLLDLPSSPMEASVKCDTVIPGGTRPRNAYYRAVLLLLFGTFATIIAFGVAILFMQWRAFERMAETSADRSPVTQVTLVSPNPITAREHEPVSGPTPPQAVKVETVNTPGTQGASAPKNAGAGIGATATNSQIQPVTQNVDTPPIISVSVPSTLPLPPSDPIGFTPPMGYVCSVFREGYMTLIVDSGDPKKSPIAFRGGLGTHSKINPQGFIVSELAGSGFALYNPSVQYLDRVIVTVTIAGEEMELKADVDRAKTYSYSPRQASPSSPAIIKIYLK